MKQLFIKMEIKKINKIHLIILICWDLSASMKEWLKNGLPKSKDMLFMDCGYWLDLLLWLTNFINL